MTRLENKTNLAILLIFAALIVGGIAYKVDRSKATYFKGYRCTTSDCSGHKAGYAWAEKHNAENLGACEYDRGKKNSKSFTEGCYAWVLRDEIRDPPEAPDDPH